jgi:SAM-dependent methyltransferase
MLAVARTSPLTALVLEALGRAPGSRVLEAGCGLGQYVLLLRERGFRATGVDWSREALIACRAARPVPLAQMDLRALAVRDGSVDAYLSLGVVEHDVAGPDAVLAEASRVLAPRGRLIVSVPYVNGVRRAAAPYLRRHGRALARRGAAFYQYAFSRRELGAALERHGFAVAGLTPYDPARLLRRFAPRRGSAASIPSGGNGVATPGALALVKRVLYSDAALRLLGHMLLADAVKR